MAPTAQRKHGAMVMSATDTRTDRPPQLDKHTELSQMPCRHSHFQNNMSVPHSRRHAHASTTAARQWHGPGETEQGPAENTAATVTLMKRVCSTRACKPAPLSVRCGAHAKQCGTQHTQAPD